MKDARRTFTPKSLYRGLARELDLLAPTYARLHTAHAALAPYPSLAMLLARLTEAPHDDAKKELLATLIAIRQSAPHRLWVAILIRAFRPMLGKIWKKLFGSDTQERLALLMVSFQGAILHVDPRRDAVRIAMYVRQATRRRVFASLAKEIDWNEVGFGEDADEVVDPCDHDLLGHDRALQTLQRRGVLMTHVRRVHASLSPREQAREYHKLRRRLKDIVKAGAAREEAPR